jgi:hypothetical protein
MMFSKGSTVGFWKLDRVMMPARAPAGQATRSAAAGTRNLIPIPCPVHMGCL